LTRAANIRGVKTFPSLFLALALAGVATAADSIHGIKINALDGKPIALSAWRGKAVLFVNVASQCGYTGQYRGLEALHRRMQPKGLIVVGVPCNDFGRQEPGSPEEIAGFCKKNYGVTFPLTEKIRINPGAGQHALYGLLTRGGDPVGWNFEKILVGRDGKVVQRFTSDVEPDDTGLAAAINRALK
jgi:glutathione peroxidase